MQMLGRWDGRRRKHTVAVAQEGEEKRQQLNPGVTMWVMLPTWEDRLGFVYAIFDQPEGCGE